VALTRVWIAFIAELTVDDEGLVIDYLPLFRRGAPDVRAAGLLREVS